MKVRFIGKKSYYSDDGTGGICSLEADKVKIVELGTKKAIQVLAEHPDIFEPVEKEETEIKIQPKEKPKDEDTVFDIDRLESGKYTKAELIGIAEKFFTDLKLNMNLKKKTIKNRLMKAINKHIE